MTMTPATMSALRGLDRVLLPGDAGFEDACTPWNLTVRLEPAAVAVPRTIPEVAEVVVAAASAGLRVAPMSTGHGAAMIGSAPLDDVVLLRMHELSGVSIDAEARTAKVVGGTVWGEVVAAAAPHGLTALHGSAADVAVAGYVLGGGLSFYSRAHGLASSTVRAVEVVTASGELIRASTEEHPALFWALRGGGGSFGVVVAIELDLLPIADLVAGMLLWDLDRAPEVVRAWAAWTQNLPESATTTLRLMRFPPLPELPPFLSGRQLVVIDGAVLEDDDRAAALLAPLRGLAPELDTFARVPAEGLLAVHMDPPVPTAAVSDHAMIDALSEDAIQRLLEVAGPGVQTPLLAAELRHLGGALARPCDAALSRMTGDFALFTLAVAPEPEWLAGALQATSAVVDALRPWANSTHFPNFAEREVEASAAFTAEEWERLRSVRDRYDPHRIWVGGHRVGDA